MVMCFTIAILSTTGAPLIVLLDSPYPYFFMASMLILAVLVSFCLERSKNRDTTTS